MGQEQPGHSKPVELTPELLHPGAKPPGWRQWALFGCVPVGITIGICWASYARWQEDQLLFEEFTENEARERVSAMSDERLLEEGKRLGIS